MKWIISILILAIFLIAGCIQQEKCGIEQCHGLELTCGTDLPDACTAIYQLGDFCREYFSGCEVVNGICQPAGSNTKFGECKTCVEGCEVFSDPTVAFDCERVCRSRMEMYCETDTDCSCGVRKETGECFYGNSVYVDISQQCPDFCTGIAGNMIIRCVDRQCKQTIV